MYSDFTGKSSGEVKPNNQIKDKAKREMFPRNDGPRLPPLLNNCTLEQWQVPAISSCVPELWFSACLSSQHEGKPEYPHGQFSHVQLGRSLQTLSAVVGCHQCVLLTVIKNFSAVFFFRYTIQYLSYTFYMHYFSTAVHLLCGTILKIC